MTLDAYDDLAKARDILAELNRLRTYEEPAVVIVTQAVTIDLKVDGARIAEMEQHRSIATHAAAIA